MPLQGGCTQGSHVLISLVIPPKVTVIEGKGKGGCPAAQNLLVRLVTRWVEAVDGKDNHQFPDIFDTTVACLLALPQKCATLGFTAWPSGSSQPRGEDGKERVPT